MATSTRNTVRNKIAQDGETLVTRVYWTEEERDLLREDLLDQLRATGKDMSEWRITNRMVMIAQLKIISEERYREIIQPRDVEALQERVDAYVKEHLVSSIVSAHNTYLETHGKTPISHAFELRKQVETLSRSLDEALAQNEALAAQVEAQRETIDKLITAGKSSYEKVVAPAPVESSQNSDLKLFIGATKLAAQCINQIKGMAKDVVFLQESDGRDIIRRKVANRVALVLEGNVSPGVASTMRDHALNYQLIRGGQSALIKAVQSQLTGTPASF
jgi:hypothetical protein